MDGWLIPVEQRTQREQREARPGLHQVVMKTRPTSRRLCSSVIEMEKKRGSGHIGAPLSREIRGFRGVA